MAMKLNCDLGESFGAWTMGLDEAVMPHIDMANIACGFHAGDPSVIAKTLQLAKQNAVTIGAHPSYPDMQGFGRRSMVLSIEQLTHSLHYQIAALQGMAQVYGLTLKYVKPHGALYNDMMFNEAILTTVMGAIASYPCTLKLMMLATANSKKHQAMANNLGIQLILEAFADRQYNDNGHLVPREVTGSVHEKPALLQQVKQLLTDGSVITQTGNKLYLNADTLCVHGDNADAITLIRNIKALCTIPN